MNKGTIQKIVNSGYECCMAITGGGTGAIENLTRYGGASKFLVSAHVPYSKNAFNYFTRSNRQKDFVSLEACKELTYSAYDECFRLSKCEVDINSKIIGLGCTAKLIYDGERTGRIHEAFIGITIGSDKFRFYKLNFSTTGYFVRERKQQEECLSNAILALLGGELGSKANLYQKYYSRDEFTVVLIEGKG